VNYLLIPVKNLDLANERLSTVLTQKDRTSLAYEMLKDVFEAASESKLADKIVVVTLDKKAMLMADELGFAIINEETQESESSSVDYALNVCKEMGAESVLVIPGDAPLITAHDIDFVIKKVKDHPHVIMVPAADKLGTNAILRKPPDVITSMFGHDSFRKHKQQADDKNIPYEVYELPNIALDIDEPADIEQLKSLGRHTKAYRELIRLGLIKEVIKKTG
jgi:2-phospho-L-lactate guanylyltransferase